MNKDYHLLTHLRDLPTSAGIYEYYDKDDKLLYVGKAKNLKNRIRSYFSLKKDIALPKVGLSPRIHIMVSQIARIHTLLTNNEQDALILENSLIKSLKPKYNVLLRDDKTYPYIYIDKSQPFPRLDITRQKLKSGKIEYFGPFVSGARTLLESIYEVLPLVQKASCIRSKKACVFYQIGKCLAPCENKISKGAYSLYITKALRLLNDKKELIEILNAKMHSYAKGEQFEQAAHLRDKIATITDIKNHSPIDMINSTAKGDFDVFCIETQKSVSVLMKLFVRDGRIVSSDFTLLHQNIESHSLPQLYTQAILNHYKAQIPVLPKEILIPHFAFEDIATLQSLLFSQLNVQLNIIQPQRGDKKALLNLASKNAIEILRLQSAKNEQILYEIANLLLLDKTPFSIEIFDTSHHSGKQSVGGMVVWENGAFAKDKYRRYLLQGSDEYTQMNEMLSRRVKRFESSPPPDLWVLDGGKAQIYLASEILHSVGANVDVVGIAKHKIEKKANRAKGDVADTLRTKHKEFKLSSNDKRLQFLQKLRDEAHRYAITYHRYKKQEKAVECILNNVHYSQAQIKRLLGVFGSFEAIQNADSNDIKAALKKHSNAK